MKGLGLLLASVLLAGCVAHVSEVPPEYGTPAGFLVGYWHGCIAAFTMVAHAMGADVRVYDVHNAGGWYDFGFLLGVSSGGGAASSAQRGETRRRARRG